MASRTLQFCPFSNNSTIKNHVLVTYFVINNKSTIGNLLSEVFLMGSQCKNFMLYIIPSIFM